MEWYLVFLISWGVFILLKGWEGLKKNIWGGVTAVFLQFLIDSKAINHKLYKVEEPILVLWDSSVFFIFGPVFVVGILAVKFYPGKRWAQVASVLVLTTLYSFLEHLLVLREKVIYTNWQFSDSIWTNLGVMVIIAWIATAVLKKGAYT